MFLPLLPLLLAEPVQGYVDLHIHIAAHLAVPVYGAGPESAPPAHQSNFHALKPQIFADQLMEPGPAILVSLAYANPFFTDFETRNSMRARIERQLAYVEAFCQRHATRFGLARTPVEARAILASGRTVIVHGIEGATKILNHDDDAQRWARRGVAVITPVHLADNAIGGAWCQEGSLLFLNVPGCWREAFAPARHGLSSKGADWIRALVDAGIIVDLAHMSHASFAKTITILREKNVAPVYTHVTAAAVRQDPNALSDAEIGEIEGLGGLMGVTANFSHLRPRPLPTLPPEHCPGSIDDFRLQWDHIVTVTGGEPVAWGSDFQGGVDHPRPRYGPHGCLPEADHPMDRFDIEGLSNPGLVEPMFAQLAREGADRRPLDASAERFLQIWERAQH